MQFILHFRYNPVISKNVFSCVTDGNLVQILFFQKLCVVRRNFPTTKNRSKKKKNEWLVSSPMFDNAFCKYCSFFPSNQEINPRLATKGVNYWKSCISKLVNHLIKGSHGLAWDKFIGVKLITKALKKNGNNQMSQAGV